MKEAVLEKARGCAVSVISGMGAIGLIGSPFAWTAYRDITRPEPIPTSCGESDPHADNDIAILGAVLGGEDATYTLEDPIVQRFIENSYEPFSFNNIDGLEENIESVQSLADLTNVANMYGAAYGWRFNFGPDAKYPRSVYYEPNKDADTGGLHVEESDINLIKAHVRDLLIGFQPLPIEILGSQDMKTYSIFKSWYHLGEAHYDTESSHHVSSVLYGTDPEEAIDVAFHEYGHVYDLDKCFNGRKFNPDSAFADLNEDSFRYGGADGDVDHSQFGSDGANENTWEDRAAAHKKLLDEGLLPPDHAGYDAIIEQKKRELARRWNASVPGAYNFFVAQGILKRGT